jgi:O-antigen/teichoic acid export membrane protein
VQFSKNLLAGLLASAWTAVLGLAAVPFYIRYLGVESYGLIAFFASLQTLFQLLDLGLAPTINREIARSVAAGNRNDGATLLHSLGVIYWAMATFIAGLLVAFAPMIATSWLNAKDLPPRSLSHALALMGLVIGCRWPISLYQGALFGMQRIVVASAINMAMLSMGTLGALLLLATVSPSIELFFGWQLLVGLAHALTMRWRAWRELRPYDRPAFSLERVRVLWRFSLSVGALTLSGVIFAQLDKVILSKMLGLSQFAVYALACVVAGSLSILIAPFYNALYPRFATHTCSSGLAESLPLYSISSKLLASLLFPLAAFLAAFGLPLVRAWTGNLELAENAAPLIGPLVLGTAVHGMMYVPHALQLAYGKTSIPLITNFVLLALMAPTTILFTLSFGALGGARAWLLLHVLYMLLGTGLSHYLLSRDTGFWWIWRSMCLPALFSVALYVIGSHYVASEADFRLWMKLSIGAGMLATTIALCILGSTFLRRNILEGIRRIWATQP